MNSVIIKDISDFVERVGGFDLIGNTNLFRGQSKKGNLLPSIARANPNIDTSNSEKGMLDHLRLKGATYLKGDETDWDLLVLAQHYGMKTRLLDWTSNPLAALWFACQKPEGGYVYALTADYFINAQIYNQSPFDLKSTYVFQPKLNNSRIIAQHGWFTVHRYSEKDQQFIPLEKNAEMKKEIYEFVITDKIRNDIFCSLDRFGISHRTLFPDLEGLCKYLNWCHDYSRMLS